MVKLAQTIGASGIAQGTREGMNMGSHVIDVRQNLYSDTQERNAVRVFPFSDIDYAGAEVAEKSSVIASCRIPCVVGVNVKGNEQGKQKMNLFSMSDLKKFTSDPDKQNSERLNLNRYLATGYGMADYLFGISPERSLKTVGLNGGYDKARRDLFKEELSKGTTAEGDAIATVDGTSPLSIKQYMSEKEALDDVTAQPAKMIIGYVIGPRDVKLYYTETAIMMMVRRMRRIVSVLGSLRPIWYPIGLGHLSSDKKNGKPWYPKGTPGATGGKPNVWQPSDMWYAGNVEYQLSTQKALGSMYIDETQIPYPTERREYKYNHIMTQLGIELMETLQAIGVDLDNNLNAAKSPFNMGSSDPDRDNGVQIAALQMLFSSMFGVTTALSPSSDFVVDEVGIAGAIKDDLGLLFNSGHIHIDPGVFTYGRAGDSFITRQGRLRTTTNGLTYKGKAMSPAGIMNEFIAKYFAFIVAKKCVEGHFTVPLFECHWTYTNTPKAEFVTEQLKMNFASDVYFDGDNSQPFTLIPSRLNPGEIISRVPCYMMISNPKEGTKRKANSYLGYRQPKPMGNVLDIRFSGDKPLTTIEETDYTFTPIIEADSHVNTQYRNSRTVNCAVLPRPTHFSPSVTKIGAIYGMLSDNASVGGHYYYQPLKGVLVADTTDKIYRAMKNSETESAAIVAQLMEGATKKDIDRQQEYWRKNEIEPENNPQTATPAGNTDGNIAPDPIFPTTVTGVKEDG